MKIIIKNISILPVDEKQSLIRNGSIGIEDNRIAFVNDSGEIPPDFKPDRVIEGSGKLVMPGLVNAHTHCAMTLLRNYADDLALEDWLFNKIFPAEAKLKDEDIYWGTMLGIAEMIKSGTTAFADMYLHMDAVAQGVLKSGIRANLSRSPYLFGGEHRMAACDESKACMDFHKTWNNAADGRIKVSVEVHSTYLFDEDTLRCSADLAKQLQTGIQIHILETMREREETQKRYGMSAVEICEKCGILDVPVIAAHCVYVSDRDMEILKRRKVYVAHNPTSNLKLGSGIARIPKMLENGIHVCLGTDGTASNNNLNMFEEMHLSALIHKGVAQDPTVMPAEQVIEIATLKGAAACGFGEEVGCIRAGMKADLILLNMDEVHLSPVSNPVSALVYAAQGSDVETVIVDGKILMENRELKTIDEALVKHEVREIARKLHGH